MKNAGVLSITALLILLNCQPGNSLGGKAEVTAGYVERKTS
jgi:hypothetical protein